MELRLKLMACLLVIACPAVAAAQAAPLVISVNCAADGNWKTWNPGDAAGFVPALNWNNIPGASGTASLLANDGTTSGGTVAWGMLYGGSDFYSSQGGPTPNTIMMGDYIDAGSGGPLTLTFSGLPSSISSLYDVYVYIAGWPTLNRTGDYTLTAGSVTTTIWATQGANALPFTLATNGTAGNYIEFADVSGGSFTLVTAASSGRAPVDGIQIVQATPAPIVPVPANAIVWTARRAPSGALRSLARAITGPITARPSITPRARLWSSMTLRRGRPPWTSLRRMSRRPACCSTIPPRTTRSRVAGDSPLRGRPD